MPSRLIVFCGLILAAVGCGRQSFVEADAIYQDEVQRLDDLSDKVGDAEYEAMINGFADLPPEVILTESSHMQREWRASKWPPLAKAIVEFKAQAERLVAASVRRSAAKGADGERATIEQLVAEHDKRQDARIGHRLAEAYKRKGAERDRKNDLMRQELELSMEHGVIHDAIEREVVAREAVKREMDNRESVERNVEDPGKREADLREIDERLAAAREAVERAVHEREAATREIESRYSTD
ncbi:MAG TPA: hypothetical protein VMV69_30415 [Pirellulales bacterium]|nr:hypothetical protein [Pirellulales bacterium]